MSTAGITPVETPFLGLRYFTEDDAELFFGRDEQVDELLAKLHESRFVTVIGSSGSGKSSLVSAGLIPALRAGYLGEAGSRWRIARSTPGNNPIGYMANALAQNGALGTPDPDVVLHRGPLGLVEAVEQARLPGGTNVLVLADQFEELFRYLRGAAADSNLLSSAEREASDFVRLLLEASAQRAVPIYVILTMRSDFLGECSRFRNLPERINKGLYLVPRLQRDQLRQAIAGPVGVAGAKITAGLVERVLNDIGDDQDQLPIFQHALLRTWKQRPPGVTLDLPHYQAGALNRHAEEIYENLNVRQKYLAEAIFRRITEVDESREIRRPATLDELRDAAGASIEELQPVIDAFRADGVCFLTQTGTLVDVTHESLIRQWVRLRHWAQQEFADRQAYEQFAAAASSDLARNVWLSGGQLARAEEWLKKERKEYWARLYRGDYEQTLEFVRLSLRARDRARRILRIAAAALLILAVTVSAILVFRWQETIRQRMLGIWQGAARQSLLDLASHEDDDRSALLARQAMLFHARTPDQPRYLVERALHQALFSDAFSHVFRGHRSAVLSVAFASNKSDRLASGSGDGTVRVWDLSQPDEPPRVLSGHRDPVNAVTFARDGNRVASAGSDGTIRVWDLAQPGAAAQVLESDGGAVLSVAFSPAGDRLASGHSDKSVRVWDLRRPRGAPTVLMGHEGAVRSVAFAPDGRLFSAGDDWAIRAWEFRGAGASARVWRGHQGPVTSIAFSPDGSQLASAGYDRTVRLWDPRQGNSTQVFSEYTSSIYSVAFDPGGHRLAAAGEDRVITIVNLDQPRAQPQVISGPNSAIRSVAFSSDGRLASGGDDKNVRVWYLQQLRVPAQVYAAPVTSVVFSPDGNEVASAGEDGALRVWRLRSPALDSTIDLFRHEGKARSVAATIAVGGGLLLVSGGEDNTMRLCEDCGRYARSPESLRQTSPVLSLAIDRAGKRLASGAADGTIRLWNLVVKITAYWFDIPEAAETVTVPLRNLTGHQGSVRSVAFAPDGGRLASGGDDRMVRVWDLNRSNPVPLVFSGHEGVVNSVSFSSDGEYLASGSDDKTIRVWDLNRPKAAPVVLSDRDQLAVKAVAFSPRGPSLASGGDDAAIRIWDLRQLQAPPQTWFGHQGPIRSVAFAPNGLSLASGSLDRTVRIWSLWSAVADELCGLIWRNLSMDEWQFYIGEGIAYERTCPSLPTGAGTIGVLKSASDEKP